MKIVLNPGEKVEVEFADSDGCITVEFGKNAISVHADLPDAAGREGIIYLEEFGADQIDKIVKKEYEGLSSSSPLLTKIKADLDLPVKPKKRKLKPVAKHTQVDSLPMTKKEAAAAHRNKKQPTVEQQVVNIIAEHLGRDIDDVIPTAKLIDDLGADSLDGVELMMAFDEEFGVNIPDEVAEAVITVQDCINAINAHMPTKS